MSNTFVPNENLLEEYDLKEEDIIEINYFGINN